MSKRSSEGNDGSSLVKLYYRIGEVSRLVGVAPHVLRYWETEFSSIRPQKSSHGQRVYSKRDVQRLLAVKDLLKNQGFTIEGARKRLRELSLSRSEPPSGIATPVSPPVELAPIRQAAPASPNQPSAKPLRSALLDVRAEIVQWLGELTVS